MTRWKKRLSSDVDYVKYLVLALERRIIKMRAQLNTYHHRINKVEDRLRRLEVRTETTVEYHYPTPANPPKLWNERPQYRQHKENNND